MAKSIVILSGGQDSTLCAAIARRDDSEVHAITFNYGQRHIAEIQSAIDVAKSLALDSHEIIDLGEVLKGTSPLVSDRPVESYASPDDVPGGVASTFVPSRNALFLTIASNRAAVIGASKIYTGVCETDYSGYPDCRREFIDNLERSLSLGNYGEVDRLSIVTPLMYLTKSESVRLSIDLLGDRFEEVFEKTHTCYQGIRGGCGKCAACLLRDRGFTEAGVIDPIWKFRNNAYSLSRG